MVDGGGIMPDPHHNGGFIITPVESAAVVYRLIEILDQLNLLIDFDWPGWDEGRRLAASDSFEGLDSITLLKLLTAIIRNDRFCDGALAAAFQHGIIEKILSQLKRNVAMD